MSSSTLRRIVRMIVFLAVVASGLGHAAAEPPVPSLSQWNHRAWRAQDGAPTEIVALAQTSDGYLWLGTGAGLFRFDGVRFEEYRSADGDVLPSLNIASLHASRDQGLFVGYRFGGLSRIKDGKAVHDGPAEGLPSGAVYAFAEEASGVIWAATLGGLLRFENAKWTRIDREWGFKGDRAYDVFLDAEGVLWVDDGSEIVRLARDARHFENTGERVERSVIRQSPRGDHWVVDAPHRLRARTRDGFVEPIANWSLYASPNAMLFDRDGDLWVAGYFGGVVRVHRPDEGPVRAENVESYRRVQGLSSDFALSILQDREGTIWVGTKGGIDQFRRPNFVPLALPSSSIEISLAAAQDGNVWVASGGGRALLAGHAGVGELQAPTSITCAIRAGDGTVWLGGPGKIWKRGPEGWVPSDIPRSIGTGDVQTMTVDPDGALWVGIIRAGLFRFKDGAWLRDGGVAGLPTRSPLTAASDAAGRQWFGYADGEIAMLDHGKVLRFGPRDGIAVGNVTTLTVEGDHLWIGGEHGLARWQDGRFVPVVARDAASLISVAGVVESADGDLWIAARKGVYRIGADDVRDAVADPRHAVRTELFDFTDGLPGVPIQHRPLPASIRASDGRVWVATADGVAWIDPASIARNAMEPPIAIETIGAGDAVLTPSGPVVLEAGTSDLSIRYTALSLARPERVRFRYRLVGANDAWSEPTARREAFFTNLGPGPYRFEVMASNDSGVWNREGKVLRFEIAPLFWQTRTFLAACIVAGLVAVYLAYLWRLRAVSRRLRHRLHERFSERERIARDLHDTLLQSVQGLILQIHALTHQDADEVPRELVDRALDKAEAIMVEGRDRVADLRDRKLPGGDFTVEVQKGTDEICEDWNMPSSVEVDGMPRPVEPLSQEDLLAILREALFNACRHAAARRIVVTLAYRRRDLRMTIEDDGVGIAGSTLAARGAPDHFGLPGMYERAQRLRGKLEIRRSQPQGTIVEVIIPGRAAYRRGRVSWRALTKRWGAGDGA